MFIAGPHLFNHQVNKPDGKTTTSPLARELGLPFPGEPGQCNAIIDFTSVQVGFTTPTDPAACAQVVEWRADDGFLMVARRLLKMG